MIKKFILCRILGAHDWTSKALQNIPPDPEKMKTNPTAYFFKYAGVYCKRCGKQSILNR